ncbi:hypothetical protein [Helicobacter sp. T3_23-1056]
MDFREQILGGGFCGADFRWWILGLLLGQILGLLFGVGALDFREIGALLA